MSSCAEVEVESPFVLPRMKSKQMLPGDALSQMDAKYAQHDAHL